MNPPAQTAWPTWSSHCDPYSGDELLLPPDAGIAVPGAGVRQGPSPAQARFLDWCRRAMRGDCSLLEPELFQSILALSHMPAFAHLPWTTPPEKWPPPALLPPSTRCGAPVAPSDDWFAEMAEDLVPDLGMEASERVLGPYSDEPTTAGQRLVAGAVMAFTPCMPPGVRPVDRYLASNRKTIPRDERSAIRAVDRACPNLWRVHDGTWIPMLPIPTTVPVPAKVHLAPELFPPTPAHLGSATGAACLARVFTGPAGVPMAAMALWLPHPEISLPQLLARLVLEWLRQRIRQPTFSWSLLLRTRADLLYRQAHELSWLL